MASTSLVLMTLVMVMNSYQSVPMESLEDVLVYPVEPGTNIRKRETTATTKNKDLTFIEEKLIQHTQALEHLVKMVQNNEDLTKNLIENISKYAEEPKLPEKVEVHHQARRSNDEYVHPIMRLANQIPKYGILLKDMVVKQIRAEPDDVIPIVEEDTESVETEFLSRRSFNGPPSTVNAPVLHNNNVISPWCSVAVVCRRTVNPVCGYDDNFGYGRFDDLCHMLQVNCYWKYNFGLVPTCRPTL